MSQGVGGWLPDERGHPEGETRNQGTGYSVTD